MHGHMYSDSLGAAAGCAPERSSLGGGVPSVGTVLIIKGVRESALSVLGGKIPRAQSHPESHPETHPKPTRTKPNHAKAQNRSLIHGSNK